MCTINAVYAVHFLWCIFSFCYSEIAWDVKSVFLWQCIYIDSVRSVCAVLTVSTANCYRQIISARNQRGPTAQPDCGRMRSSGRLVVRPQFLYVCIVYVDWFMHMCSARGFCEVEQHQSYISRLPDCRQLLSKFNTNATAVHLVGCLATGCSQLVRL